MSCSNPCNPANQGGCPSSSSLHCPAGTCVFINNDNTSQPVIVALPELKDPQTCLTNGYSWYQQCATSNSYPSTLLNPNADFTCPQGSTPCQICLFGSYLSIGTKDTGWCSDCMSKGGYCTITCLAPNSKCPNCPYFTAKTYTNEGGLGYGICS
ncbi:MAG: hypothetical protein FJZ56_01075 [Chlamydiae bacterium]|nr:hypothetical protein [Chlamydiota bacterium]